MSYLPGALRLASGCTVQAAAIWHRHSSDNRPYGYGRLRPLTPWNSSSSKEGNAYEGLVDHQGSTAQ
jgi:hypothetical protein